MNLFHITKIQKFHQRTREYNDVVICLTSIRLYTTPKNNACTSLYDIYAKSHSHAYGVKMRRRMGGLAPTIDEADGRIAKQSHGPLRITASLAQTCPAFIFVIEEPQR